MHISHTHFYKFIFLIIVWSPLIYTSKVTAQQTYHTSVDSLLSIVDSQEGEDRIKSLYLIAHNKQYDKGSLSHLNAFEKAAMNNSNPIWLGRNYHIKHRYYLNAAANMDSAAYFLDKIRELDLSDSPLLVDLEISTLLMYLIQNKYGLFLHHAQKLLNDKSYDKNYLLKAEVSLQVAHVCLIIKSKDDGFRAIDSALSYLDKANIDSHKKAFNLVQTYMLKTTLASRTGDFDLAIQSCDSMRFYTDKIPAMDEANFDLFTRLERAQRAKAYIEHDDLKNAKLYISGDDEQLIDENILDNLKLAICMNNATYYSKLGEYKKAIDYLDYLESFFPKHYAPIPDLIEIMSLRIKSLHGLKLYEESYTLMQEVYNLQDSIYYASVNEQMSDLQEVYKTERINVETRLKLRQTQIISLALFFIILLSVGMLILIRRNHRMKEKSNQKIYEQYLLMKSYLDELKVQKEVYQQLNASSSTDDCKEDTLADKIDEYLNRSEAFKNKDLTRNELALALGTNREYLTEAIREKSGKTFKDYIYDIRLEYAHRILIENENATVEEVYTESGFSSRSTFNRLFRDRYDMSPNELRELAKESISNL